MLRLEEIRKFYPENLQQAGGFLLREYLQHKILEIIYDSEYAAKLVFLGGTCLRIVHGNLRFSEDLDFDNLHMNANEFSAVAETVERGLNLIGYRVEMKVVHRTAYHCYIRFPDILFNEKLSGHKEQKILIQLDTEPQNFDYRPEIFLLNRFDVFTEVFVCPPSLLLAQKYFAVLNRKRNKGRDFYDISFLLGKSIQPDWEYLKQKTGIEDRKELKNALLQKCADLDMDAMADDVGPFLFRPVERKRVVMFERLIRQAY